MTWLAVADPASTLLQPGLFKLQPERQQLARQHFQHGVTHAREGRLQSAIGHLKYTIGLDPTNVDAYFMLGLVYYHLGLSHLRETDYAMNKVLELQPKHPDALIYRGLTRMRLGAFAAALGFALFAGRAALRDFGYFDFF